MTKITKKYPQYNIHDLQKMPMNELIEFLEYYKDNSDQPQLLMDRILNPLLERAKTIKSLGLGYLNLTRSMDTLSGWEIQRLRLAKQLGNKLTGITYVLDEPTIGLDDWEIEKVIAAIKTLQKMWNTIVVVEHNEEFIINSDWVIEIWPGAGDFGGELVYSGPYDNFIKQDTLTADYITGRKKIYIKFDHKPKDIFLEIRWATKNNLKAINAKIKLGSFTIVTWPSGAGKTTLLHHILFRFLDERSKFVQWQIRMNLLAKWLGWNEIIAWQYINRNEYGTMEESAMDKFYTEIWVDSIIGRENIQNVLYVDQSSIGKTPRSCPATFIWVFDNIRKLFAGTQDAKMLGLTDGHFSFNSDKWACTECDGYGYKKIELQFLPDTYVPCQLCKGKRYKSEILWIKRHNKTISDILQMYVYEANNFFEEIGFVNDELQLMVDIWLGYLKMWQSAHTLSWWESQRIKLVKHLLKQYKWHTIYFLDEPTVGLHPDDIQRLLQVLKVFLNRGDTILMIEHDKSLLQFADQVIELKNGNIVQNIK